MEKIAINNWSLGYMQHSEFILSGKNPVTPAQVKAECTGVMAATVPGNFELDFAKNGLLPENIYFGTNILQVQKYESTHLWYFTEFTLLDKDMDKFILFEGIDTVAEIYIDGEFCFFAENMLIPHEYSLADVAPGVHQLVVHIIPASVYVRELPNDPNCRAQKYNMDSLYIRKAPYMYGWDIMPRTVSAGLWRPVSIVYKCRSRIEEYRAVTHHILENTANVTLDIRLATEEDDLRDFTVKVNGILGESTFFAEDTFFSVNKKMHINIEDPVLWWPKNYGDLALYDVTVTLFYKGKQVDEVAFKLGLRTIQLQRTSLAGENGTFRFVVNGKPVMCLGTNWVPTDAFPSRHDEFTLRGLQLVNDLNCNMIRCWGGNVYPSDQFYDYCDEHGILIWQDFSMACGRYPNDERFCILMQQEAEAVVKRLRNHACIALWSGDNECDYMYLWDKKDPNTNKITRKVLPETVEQFDGFMPYLPSSPYLDKNAIDENFKAKHTAEDHLWGPRDYFKGDFYNKNSVCHFASETGYHGCPAPETLKKFIGAEHLDNYGDTKLCNDPQWLVHAACPEVNITSPFAYRIPLMTRQVERIFDTYKGDISSYALKSQISQAEAVKFFIEHFRIQKNYRWGILWWNIIDGWPQISDAVVDWYGTKKLAYSYIKRSQQPFNIMCDEPDSNGNLTICAVNDTRNTVIVEYTVTEAVSGEVIADGTATVQPDTLVKLNSIKEIHGQYYLISWSGDACGTNHFTAAIGDHVDLDDYITFMKKAGYYSQLEGF